MSKNLSAKHYQENKERLQKKLAKDIQILLKKKKKKSNNTCDCCKNLSKNEKQKLVEDRKKYYRMRKKCFIIIVRNYFNLENCKKFTKKSVRNF